MTFEVIEQFASIKLFQLECIFSSFKFLPRTFPLTAGSEDFVDLSDNEIFEAEVAFVTYFHWSNHASVVGLPDVRYFTANLAEAGKKPVF